MSRLLFQFTHLYYSFGSRPLFEDISLSINEGDVFALIGENGCGKTTLLKLIKESAPHLTIGFLPQEAPNSALTTRAYIEEGPLSDLEKQMAACLESERLTEWAVLHEEYENLGGYRQLPLEKIFQGLKLDALLDMPLASLSGGERIRAALAKALIENPELLLLDEPTNHLDAEMQCWLQEMLRTRKGSTVIVSHDRKFLNETCNRLIEIKKGKLVYYGGSYDFYLEEQGRLLERQLKAHLEQKEERERLKQKMKAITFSKGKPPPPSDRNIMAYDKRGELHQKSVKRNLDDLKARLADIEANPIPHPRPKTIKGLYFHPEPLPSHAIECEGIGKAFGDKVLFSGLNLSLCKGDRIVLTGPNGSGKTTLLKCIAGQIPLDSGTIRRSQTARISYLDQEVEMLPMEQTPFHYFETRFNLTREDLLRELHKAALEGDGLNRPFSTLSVGQRKRLMLLTLILERPNVLLLDEPTNHLDFLTLEAFEKALLNFEGAILAVSHDWTFINKIATHPISLQ